MKIEKLTPSNRKFNHQKLRKSRIDRRMSNYKVWQKTGISQSTLSRYEGGLSNPIDPHSLNGQENLIKLARLYGVGVGDFFGE